MKGSKTETNLTQVVSTHASTSQADRSDSDSSVFSLSLLLPLLFVTQIMLSGSWIAEPPTMCARTGPGFLALRSWMDVTQSWV